MFIRYSNSLISFARNLFSLFVIVTLIAPSLESQRVVSEADTGRLKWGHADFRGYNRATMCHRALDQATRYHTRRYRKDTSVSPIIKNSTVISPFPKATIETAKACIAHLNLETQDLDQLWAVARIYLILGELDNSVLTAERAISYGLTDEEKMDMKIQAFVMYLNHSETTIALAYQFAKNIKSTLPENHVGNYEVDLAFASYYFIRYNVDSVYKYSLSAIEELKKMSIEDMDKVLAYEVFALQLAVANEKGDISEEIKILEVASKYISGWRSGSGARQIQGAMRGIDAKKNYYNKQMPYFKEATWYNSDGQQRPKIGVLTLIVKIDHNCGNPCYNRLKAVKRLKATFGDKLDVILIASTMGYVPGSGPLDIQEEGREVAQFFKRFHELPYPLLVDESPTHKLDDGRIVRDNGPIAQLFSDFNQTNAIITDMQGRVQWAGIINSEQHIRLLAVVLERVGNRKLD